MKATAKVHARAALVGATLGLVVELGLLLSGGPLFGYENLGDVFDAQARSLLDGRWDIPTDVVKIEGFEIAGRAYTYFGPVPALLRVPVVALTDAFDGRLTRVSLLLACMVTLAMAARLSWRARRILIGDDAPVERVEQTLVALFVFTVGAGSSVTYLAARPSVYHEAIAWGVAVSLVAVEAVLMWIERGTHRRFVLVVVLATAALLTRASVGAGPVLAVGFVLLGDVVGGLRARQGRAVARSLALGLALAIPLATYAAVNNARFGTLFTLPYERHRVSMVDEHRRQVLAANGGTIQGPQFLPTTALHFVRPDALGVDGTFPWIDFPRRARVVGDVLMDEVDVASSVPSSMPALTLLAAIGAIAQVRRSRLRRWSPVTAGTSMCLIVTLAIGFVAHRYTADALPLLVVAGAVAVPVLATRQKGRGLVVAGVAVSSIASVAITAALTIQFQQHYGFHTSRQLRAALAARQLELPSFGNSPSVVRTTDALPPVGRDRTFAVVGPCAGLYRSDGLRWHTVEGTPATGHYRVRVRRGAGPVALFAGITVTWLDGDVVVTRGAVPTRPLAGHRRSIELEVFADRRVGLVDVRHRGELVLTDYYFDWKPGDAIEEGGRVRVLPSSTPVCDELTGRSS